ncbi:MAG: TraB/GumN family protein [Methylobacteriaceae bacterium]|nr:TraB/GumN family protein [Methylobacteriaceae bacterium]
MMRVPVAAAVLLVPVFLSGASAAAPDSGQAPPLQCSGKNLVDEAQRTNPGVYQTILDKTNAIPNAEGLLWKVEKRGEAPSYLFGTMHSSDARAIAIAQSMAQYLKGIPTLVTELGGTGGPESMAAVKAKMAERVAANRVETAALIDSPQDRALVGDLLKGRGVEPASALRMPPWLLMSFLEEPPCEIARERLELPAVDQVIEDIGTRLGARLVGLETLDEQLDALQSIDPKLAARMIIVEAKQKDFADDMLATMLALYTEQRVGELFAAPETLIDLAPQDIEADRLYTSGFIEKRNVAMEQRIRPLMAAGPVFIAVGAMHLIGAGGLVELFRREGFTVTRVDTSAGTGADR